MAKIRISRVVDREREREREKERKKANERNFVSIIGAQLQMRKHTATWATEMESVLGGNSWKLRLDVYVRFLQEIDKENDNEVLHRLPSCSSNSHYKQVKDTVQEKTCEEVDVVKR